MTNRTKWFKKARWGVFCHYLADTASSRTGTNITIEEWNNRVDSFDTERLAEQLEQVKAGYFIITLGQNSGFYCAPNATYDRLVGLRPSKCSRRDLIMDLAHSLSKRNIPLMLYCPSGAPENDPVAVQRLEWKKNGGRLKEFQLKWEAVLTEWSLRYGKKIAGWWIDGCYYDEMYNHAESPNYDSFAGALRAGNPAGIICFNSGINKLDPLSKQEDYLPGELAQSLYLGRWKDGKYIQDRDTINGVQLHLLTFLGEWWGKGGKRLPDALAVGYTQYINQLGGVISWDVPVGTNGEIPGEFVEQLALISKGTLG